MQRKMRRQAEQSKENKKEKRKGGEVGGQKRSIAYYRHFDDLIPRDPRQEAPTCLCFLPCMLEISSTCHLR